MISQSGIDAPPSKRITRTWFPDGRQPLRRNQPERAARAGSSDTDEAKLEVEEDPEFVARLSPSHLPWRLLIMGMQRVLPLVLAALVGALTALAWQSYLPRAAQAPAASAAPGSVTPASETTAQPAKVPAVSDDVAPAPAPTQPPSLPLLGAGVAPQAPDPVRANRPAPGRRPPVKTRPRLAVPSRAPAVPAASADPDAILQPTFL